MVSRQPQVWPDIIGPAFLRMPFGQVLLGTIAGDGSLNQGSPRARGLEITHSEHQMYYVMFKQAVLTKNFVCTEVSPYVRKPDKLYKSSPVYTSYLFSARTTPEFEALSSIVYLPWKDRSVKLYHSFWLKRLDLMGMAIWWCNDGRLNWNNFQGDISTHCTYDEALECYFALLEVLPGVKFNPSRKNNKGTSYFVINVLRQTLEKFLMEIVPFIPLPNLLYKFVPKHKSYQETFDWLAFIKKEIPEFEPVINKFWFRPLQVLKKRGYDYNLAFEQVYINAKAKLCDKKSKEDQIYNKRYFIDKIKS